jgi:4-carboxymuconolactone decarboxylase
MAEIDDQAERGIALASEMLGPKFGNSMRAHISSGGFAAAIARGGMVHSYTDCWSRPGLTRQQRSLATIGALIGLKQPSELKNHIRIGVANGLTVKEIEEVLIQLSTYVGYPAIASATTAVVEVLRELGLALDAKTSEERGVL